MKKVIVAGVSAIVVAMVTMMGCDNTPGPGTAEVKVIDADGITQAGVHVTLFCTEPNCVVRRTGKTNELGVYRQDFDLPVVLRIRSVRYDTTVTKKGTPPHEIKTYSVDSVCGEGYTQIENDQISSETVTIVDCN